jgi:DNA-directed RNA polymerase specialized sigma24 family protein
LRDMEEIPTEETAELLGIFIPAVKSRLLRA